MIRAEIFAQIKTADLLREYNKFLQDNNITDITKVKFNYNNNVIFLMWQDDSSDDYLDTLNKQPATTKMTDKSANFLGSTNETEKYIDSGC